MQVKRIYQNCPSSNKETCNSTHALYSPNWSTYLPLGRYIWKTHILNHYPVISAKTATGSNTCSKLFSSLPENTKLCTDPVVFNKVVKARLRQSHRQSLQEAQLTFLLLYLDKFLLYSLSFFSIRYIFDTFTFSQTFFFKSRAFPLYCIQF